MIFFSGVGKTSFAKYISASLFRHFSSVWPQAGDGFYQISIANYNITGSSSPESIDSARRDLIAQVYHAVLLCPRAVILIDELESLHPSIATALIPVLKGEPLGNVDTSEIILILTSDFGKEGVSRGRTVDEIQKEVYHFSAEIYSNLAIASLVYIIPFTSLARSDFQSVIEYKLKHLPCILDELSCVEWEENVSKYVTDVAWKGLRERNGRQIDETFDILVSSQLSLKLNTMPLSDEPFHKNRYTAQVKLSSNQRSPIFIDLRETKSEL